MAAAARIFQCDDSGMRNPSVALTQTPTLNLTLTPTEIIKISSGLETQISQLTDQGQGW